MNDQDILIEFLNYPLGTGEGILEHFSKLYGADHRGNGLKQFVYIPGNRKKKGLLVAHADTHWDQNYSHGTIMGHQIVRNGNVIYSGSENFGIGADDRAGCAIIWLLRYTGHSLLITNGEEDRRHGSKWLMDENYDIADKINKHHQFVV
jgi:hypothetical protein